jgi:hypothetical protein
MYSGPLIHYIQILHILLYTGQILVFTQYIMISKEVYDLLEDPPVSDAINLYLKGIKYHLPVYLVGHPFH